VPTQFTANQIQMFSRHSRPALLAGVLFLGAACQAPGIIFYETGDVTHNRETAPSGAWTGAGWQYQGYYKAFLGTMISPRHFVTARHVGLGTSTFVHKKFFSGAAVDVTYYLNPNVNGGGGYWNVPGTDLRIFEIYGEFPGYAELYTDTDEVGKELVMMGRGRERGADVIMTNQVRGWMWGANTKRARWGVNNIDSIYDGGASAGDLLVCDLDPITGSEECHVASGDSGGAVFVDDGGTWKLAGILYGVDGQYDTNSVCGDASQFDAAMFNALGFFIGQDSPCEWEPASILDDTNQSRSFATRISSSATTLQGIIQPAIDDAAKTPLQRYEEWLASFGLVSVSLEEDDSDGDWQPDLTEYLAALDPSEDQPAARAFEVGLGAGTVEFTLRVRLDAAARGLNHEIQQAPEVTGPWTAVTGLNLTGLTRPLAEGVETRSYDIVQPPVIRQFYRLAVTIGP